MSMRTPALLCLVLLAAATLRAQVDNEVVGIVNSKAVTRYDILESLRKQEVDLSKLSATEQQRAFLEVLTARVLDIVKEEAAKRSGVAIDLEDYINIRNAAIETQFGGEPGFTEYLREQGMSEEDWNADFRRQQEQYAWLRVVSGRGGARLSRDLRPLYDMTIRPREIRDYYRKNRETKFTFQDEAVVRVIQVYFARDGEDRAAQLLAGLKRKLETKADFAVLAQKNSEHTSKNEGGLIGSVVKGKGTLLPEVVEEAVFAEGVAAGDVIGPIKNINSLWLVKVEKRQQARTLSFEDAQDQIRRDLYVERSTRILTKLQLDLVKEAYISPPDLKRRVVGALELRLTR